MAELKKVSSEQVHFTFLSEEKTHKREIVCLH